MMRCEAEAMGAQCELDEGHDGMHKITGTLPPDIGRLVDNAMTELETARDLHLRAARRATQVKWFTFAVMGVYLCLVVAEAIW